jgi:hypothetical protein
VNFDPQRVWLTLEDSDFNVIYVQRARRPQAGFADKGHFHITAALPKGGIDVLEVVNPGPRHSVLFTAYFESHCHPPQLGVS